MLPDPTFDARRLDRVVALAYPPNRASTRAMEKIGMRLEREVESYGGTLVRYSIHRPL